MLKIAVLLSLVATPTAAHDYWASGRRVPEWVKDSCCSAADVHHLTPDQVHRVSDNFYRIDGYPRLIPISRALPSQDGNYWIFYADHPTCGGYSSIGCEAPSDVYCFFVPMDF